MHRGEGRHTALCGPTGSWNWRRCWSAVRLAGVAISAQLLGTATALLAAGREVIEKHVRLWGVTMEASSFTRGMGSCTGNSIVKGAIYNKLASVSSRAGLVITLVRIRGAS